jgi:hypothetical protein
MQQPAPCALRPLSFFLSFFVLCSLLIIKHELSYKLLSATVITSVLTSASGDAIWGAHRPNYIHGQFGGFFLVPQVPPAPRCTPVVIPTKLTPRLRLSLAPCCAGQPSFGHIQAAPRWALAPVESSPGLVIWPVSGTRWLVPVWPVCSWSFKSTIEIERDNIHLVAPR